MTNQMMNVQIGKEFTVQIGHKTEMGKLNDVLTIGNEYRKRKGLREIEMREWLAKETTWEFILEVEREFGNKFQTPDSGVCLSDYKNIYGKIEFAQLIKQFSVIKSQRGGKPENRGYWANLYIMLDLASHLSSTLKLEMYKVFINQKILFWRDLGGENFKEFNSLIDTLPDRKGKNNRNLYIEISLEIRRKLSILSTKGYNEKEHHALIQENRAEWLKSLNFAIKVGFIKSYEELKDTFEKLELIEEMPF
jgi:hypothetical protein